MKSYAGNWQINRNSRNWMSEKILSERIPLNGQWNNRTSLMWPETRHGREGRSQTSFFLYKIDEIKWQSNTGQSVLKSKGFYWAGGHFTGLVRRYFIFTDVFMYWLYFFNVDVSFLFLGVYIHVCHWMLVFGCSFGFSYFLSCF